MFTQIFKLDRDTDTLTKIDEDYYHDYLLYFTRDGKEYIKVFPFLKHKRFLWFKYRVYDTPFIVSV